MRDHVAVDQYGVVYWNLGKHPRKTLLERLDRKRASRMFNDTKLGGEKHTGWVIAGRWLTVLKVEELNT